MKLLSRRVALSGVLLFAAATSSSFASVNSVNPLDPINDTMDKISKYLLNLGQYLGYNLDDTPSSELNDTILQITGTALQNILLPTVKTFYGALPVNTTGISAVASTDAAPPYFVPGNNAFSILNNSGNSTFLTSRFSDPSNNISISPLIDQPTSSGTGAGQTQYQYQNDPVSQALANILMTPDYSFCLDNQGQNWVGCDTNQAWLNDGQVMQNVIGTIPGTADFYKGTFNLPAIMQLNSNSLIAPLMYTTQAAGALPQQEVNTGPQPLRAAGPLVAQTPAQQAINFIRYATSAVTPVPLAARNFYDKLYQQYSDPKGTVLSKFQAGYALTNYLLNLRVFAAQNSVGISNLYYILSKRMQQPVVNTSGQAEIPPTSQSLSEYQMATWRLFDPKQANNNQGNTGSPGNTEWLAGLNTASAATVQKEIAVLLAEINYQLYLNRQQEERILLTNSILLLQNAKVMEMNGFLRASGDTSTSDAAQ
ncbi:type IVB secretion system protein IcmX [Legionella jamestowniensis]|uniref:Intracellular multiplication protein IcmX n=1 Tax=Legionella jamestowniensis TaxID=455 RepID=A0A0W0UYR0_9GAMM|nr:type IVB secretion system protein IcmX [Legionella jamestowniensis]KTD12996.1 Intracellular multiplication protein IcmX [Legionella jamestowniensis]OCH98221.1 hypothetical protein A8135_11680 [Legionella jamestowniensis]SFL79206.1 intracellular multiplication protein IcmX [Legionella jamestowniensis DSM 19215]